MTLPAREIVAVIQNDLLNAFFDEPPRFISLNSPYAQMWTMLVSICTSGQKSAVEVALKRASKAEQGVNAAMKGVGVSAAIPWPSVTEKNSVIRTMKN